MNITRCSVVGCPNSSKTKGITIYTFEPGPHASKQGVGNGITPNCKSALCSQHLFLKDSIQQPRVHSKVKHPPVPVPNVCRACLVMGTKMFNIYDNDLQKWFQEITGITLFEKEKLPHTLCFQCVRTLENCIKFQEKSIRANTLMCHIIDDEGVLSHERIKSINRRKNLLISNLGKKLFVANHFDFYLTEEIEMETEDIHDDMVEYLEDLDELGEGDVEYLEGIEDQGAGSDIEQIKDTDDNMTPYDHMYAKTDDNGVIVDHTDDNIMTNTDAYENKGNKLNEETDSDDFLVYEFDDKGLSDKLLDSTRDTAKIMKINRNNDVTDINDILNDDDRSDVEGFESTDELETTETKDVAKIVERNKNTKAVPLTGFTVENLTLKEQFAEVEKRKQSANYLNSNFKCPDCYKGFTSEITYNNHILLHTDAYGVYSCSICKLHFRTRTQLGCHKYKHKKRFTCDECGFQTVQQAVAKDHRNWHEGSKFTCPDCGMIFEKLSSYFSHRRIKHPTDFVCQLCGFTFLSEKGIAQHKQLKHRLLDLTIPEDGPLCELCNIRFVNEEALNQHLLVSPKHTDKESLVRNAPSLKFKRIVTCEKCGIKNEGVRAHLNHFKESHPGEYSTQRGRPLMCELCGLNFEGTRAYLSHFRQTHPGHVSTPTPCGVKKDVECELCGVHSEGTRAYLTHFRQTHPGEAPKQCDKRKHIMCELCGKMFQRTAHLRQHSLIHAERGFKCEICDKTFTTKAFLMTHWKQHTDPTTYPCTLCGKHFSNDTNRRRHMLLHKNIRPYKCEICDKAFIMPCDRRAHIEHSHNKKPWPKRNPMRPRRQVTKQPAVKVERLPETKMDEDI